MDKHIVNSFYNLAEGMKKVMLKHHNIDEMSRSEFSMLHLISLCESELGMVTTALLSEQLHISKPAVSQMINTLENKQYVIREINKSDRRLISISLTEIGKQRLAEKKEKFLNKLDVILDKMGKEDSEAFISLMEKFFDVIKDIKKN